MTTTRKTIATFVATAAVLAGAAGLGAGPAFADTPGQDDGSHQETCDAYAGAMGTSSDPWGDGTAGADFGALLGEIVAGC